MRWRVLAVAAVVVLGCAGGAAGCRRSTASAEDGQRLVFVHQPLGGDPAAFAALLDEFRRDHPGVTLQTQLLPNASDVAHQYFVTALEGETRELDVLVLDIVWVQEFAKAGWVADLSEFFPPAEVGRTFLPGAAEAVTFDGGTYALPWYVDVGLLYFRRDLVPRAPVTYEELSRFAKDAQAKDRTLQGYLFQGRQYEGLVCNGYERIWGFGGESLSEGRLPLETREAAAALASMRALVEDGVSPPSVTSAAEEEARRAFQSGRAVFMRNWPYAWRELEAEGSPVRGKVGFAALPSADGGAGPGVLGGWQLAVNAHVSPSRKALAAKLLSHLTSERANVALAKAYGRNPARHDAYESEALTAAAPFVVELLPHLKRARPRPVTPYYGMITDVLQSEFSAALAGIRSPEESLSRAQVQVDRVMGTPAR